MNTKIRLGPMAVFILLVAVVLTTLAMLAQATSHADLVMAERFADVTAVRYSLEEEGQNYLMQIDEALKAGDFDAAENGAEVTEDGNLRHTVSRDGYDLVIEITDPGKAGKYKVIKWNLSRQWEAEGQFQNIWQG